MNISDFDDTVYAYCYMENPYLNYVRAKSVEIYKDTYPTEYQSLLAAGSSKAEAVTDALIKTSRDIMQ